jgi:hypothetical protein
MVDLAGDSLSVARFSAADMDAPPVRDGQSESA